MKSKSLEEKNKNHILLKLNPTPKETYSTSNNSSIDSEEFSLLNIAVRNAELRLISAKQDELLQICIS